MVSIRKDRHDLLPPTTKNLGVAALALDRDGDIHAISLRPFNWVHVTLVLVLPVSINELEDARIRSSFDDASQGAGRERRNGGRKDEAMHFLFGGDYEAKRVTSGQVATR
jgi:hypothetical protein